MINGLNMKISNFMEKLKFAIINLKKPSLSSIETLEVNADTVNSKKLIFILIDYDKFLHREIKSVKHAKYKCGRSSIECILNYAKSNCFDYIEICTTDDPLKADSSLKINGRNFIKNEGTDIAALKSVESIISEYDSVLVANSSCAFDDANKISLLAQYALESRGNPYVAGYNANSRISPRLPFSDGKYPHIITNLFATRSIELREILHSENSYRNLIIDESYCNKYFSIRYFETLLSSWVIHKGGSLVLIDSANIIFPLMDCAWPKTDTRIERFS